MMKELSKQYNPSETEGRIYKLWEESGFFAPDKLPGKRAKTFTVMMAPPNITGSLHMGHALENTLVDVLVRLRRMKGFQTLWLPGIDHAGIATQNVVEKELKKAGKRKEDLGREKFEGRVWEWKEKYGSLILEQLKKLGVSPDWSRTRFTLDKDYVKAVEIAFNHYYQKGWIYQGERTINWCPRCQTGLSDLEVVYKKIEGHLWYIKYYLKSQISNLKSTSQNSKIEKYVVVVTTRPETMLGDTAVAVHPRDKRYKSLVGKKIILPLINREIPVVVDEAVDPKFGSGAVKVTPAHSIADFEIGERHHLLSKQVIDEHGRMMKNCGQYAGMKTAEAREAIVVALEKMDLIDHIDEGYDHSIAACYRCGTVLEPIPSKQWFVKMAPLAKIAIEAVKSGKVKITPKRFEKPYFDWLENIRDWCISRQLWWGHRLPVWKPKIKNQSASRRTKIKIKENYYIGDKPPKGYVQVEDVLDTWFSSALWPFATLGWPFDSAQGKPQKDSDLAKYYPTDFMTSARDILHLWITRMIFSGLEFTGEVPFKTVYIHPTILTREGRRMSKSLGTGVDPLTLIEKYGADGVRFGLVWQMTGNQDIRFSEDSIVGARNFCNKLWNASRFVIGQIGNLQPTTYKLQAKTSADKDILKKTADIIKSTTENIEKLRFGQAAQDLYHFFWHEFCDKYLETAKKQLQDAKTKQSTSSVLNYVLITSLKLLHPFMPFVTEEIYQIIHSGERTLMIAKWPK